MSTKERLERLRRLKSLRDKQISAQGNGPNAIDSALSVIEPAVSIASSAPAAVASGLSGIGAYAGAKLAGANESAAADAAGNQVAQTQQAMTYQPRTQAGQSGLRTVGEVMRPVAEFGESVSAFAGDTAYEISGGNPVSGAAGYALPAALMELITAGGATAAIPAVRQTTRLATRAGKSAVDMADRVGASLQAKVQDVARRKLAEQNIQVTNPDGTFTQEAVAFLRENAEAVQSDVKGLLSPEELERYNLFVSRGVQPTKANLAGDPDSWRAQIDAAKRDGLTAQRMAEQEAALKGNLSSTADALSNSGGVLETNVRLWETIGSKVDDAEALVDQAYQAARADARLEGRGVVVDDLAIAVRSNKPSDTAAKGVVSAVEGEMQRMGLLDDAGKLTNARITVGEAERLRQYMNELYQTTPGYGRTLIRTFKNMLDEDVATFAGKDIFGEARQAKIDYQKMIERAKRDKRDKSKASLLEDIIDNKVPENEIYQKIMATTRDDDFSTVWNFLKESGGDQATNLIKGQWLRDTLQKSTGASKINGEAQFLPTKFRQELTKLKASKKWEMMFTPAERKMLDEVLQIGELLRPDSLVNRGSGPSALGMELVQERLRGSGLDWAVKAFQGVRDFRAERANLDPASGTSRYLQEQLAAQRMRREAEPPAPNP